MGVLFARGPPKVVIRLRGGLTAEKVLEGISSCEFSAGGNEAAVLLTGDKAQQAAALKRIMDLLRTERAGSIVRLTVEAAEAAALNDFGEEYVLMDSLAHRRAFEVSIKARSRSVFYVLGRTGRILSKKESKSALLDSFV